MKKHEIIIDMTNNFLVFWLSYCIYFKVISYTILSQPRFPAEIAVIRIKKDIISQKIIKRGSKENMTNFLQIPNKFFSKKRRQINKSKWKMSIGKISLKKLLLAV